jgi:DNA-binding LacI/PurR family transcriptional regulator
MDGDQDDPNAARRATSYDVARHAGVSQSAVSRCFRDGASISPVTRARVLSAARALNYAPNKIARSLITQRSRIVAVIVSEATTESYPTLLLHLGRAIQDAAHRMLVFIQSGNGDPQAALEDILGYHVDAVISGVTVPDDMMQVCAEQRIPIVVYNRLSRHPWASAVGCDDVAALDALAAHLHATGTSRLHFLGGPQGATVAESRLRAAVQAAAAHGLEMCGVTHADYSYGGGRRAAIGLLQGGVRPEAIVCANDSMALGVLDACRYDLGLRVPDDIAVTGYDDVPEGARPPYSLTTLAQPIGSLTHAALRMACERLDGTALPGEQRLMPVRLIVRRSTGRASAQDVV